MHPELFHAGPFTVYTYGVLLGAAYLIGLQVAMVRARRLGLDAQKFMDLGIAIIVSALIGAKALLFIVDFDHFVNNPGDLLALLRSGGVFYGGLVLAVLVGIWYVRKHALPVWTTGDLAAPGIALGYAVGRLGCFFAGCCWGAPGPTPPAMSFGPESIVALSEGAPLVDGATVPLHPVQLYESIGLFVLAAVLIAIRCTRGVEPRWRQASRYALGYGLLRLLTEMFRGDASRGLAWTWSSPTLAELLGLPPAQPLLLSSSQAMALVLVLVGVLGLRRTRPRA